MSVQHMVEKVKGVSTKAFNNAYILAEHWVVKVGRMGQLNELNLDRTRKKN